MVRRAFRKGFTLIELMVVVTIIAILAAMLIGGIQEVQIRSNMMKCRSNLRQLGGVIQQYAAYNGGFLPIFSWHHWIGQVPLLEGGHFGYKKGAEYPEIALNPSPYPPGILNMNVWLIYPRENGVFRCPTGRTPRFNIQGVRTNYHGLEKFNRRNLTTLPEPRTSVCLFEYAPPASRWGSRMATYKWYRYKQDGNVQHAVLADDGITLINIDGKEPNCVHGWKGQGIDDPRAKARVLNFRNYSYSADVLEGDSRQALNRVTPYRVALNHGEKGQILFMDFHVQAVEGEQANIEYWHAEMEVPIPRPVPNTTSTTLENPTQNYWVGTPKN